MNWKNEPATLQWGIYNALSVNAWKRGSTHDGKIASSKIRPSQLEDPLRLKREVFLLT